MSGIAAPATALDRTALGLPKQPWVRFLFHRVTQLAKKNGGTFPTGRMTRILDGGEAIPAHGTAISPEWFRDIAVLAGCVRSRRSVDPDFPPPRARPRRTHASRPAAERHRRDTGGTISTTALSGSVYANRTTTERDAARYSLQEREEAVCHGTMSSGVSREVSIHRRHSRPPLSAGSSKFNGSQ